MHQGTDVRVIKIIRFYSKTCCPFSTPGAQTFPCFAFQFQAAADYVKAHLPEILKQQLQAFEREKRESSLSYASILEQRILSVDREMLDKLSANHDEAGLCVWHRTRKHCHWGKPPILPSRDGTTLSFQTLTIIELVEEMLSFFNKELNTMRLQRQLYVGNTLVTKTLHPSAPSLTALEGQTSNRDALEARIKPVSPS